MANETNIKVLKLEVDTGTGEIKVNGLKSNIQGLDKAVNDFGKTAKKAQAELKNFESSAGIAGATVNELGRLVSDLPFGITAITNNLSQLGSMFAILVTKVGGFQAAIASLWRTIMGPVGILLAFQAAVAALQFWEQSSKKAEKSQDDLSKAIGGAATELKEAVKILNDENISLERKEKLLRNINSEYEGMNLSLNENNQLKETSLEQVNKEIDALIRLDKAKVLVGQLKEIREEIQILEDTPPEEVLGFWGKAKLWLMQDLLQDGLVSDEDISKAGEAAKDKILDGLQKKLAEKEGELTPELLETLFGKKGNEGGEDLTPKVQKLVFRVFGTLEEEMARYRKELQRKFGTDYLDVETLLKDSATNALKGLKPIEKAIEGWSPFDVWAYNTKSDLEEVTEGLDAIADVTEAITNVMSAEFQKQLDIEQNKTTLINNELRKRLAEEQLSADERKNIQSQISANDEKLRLKQEEIAKKRFKTEKAMRISVALIDTASSALKAYGSQLVVGDPSSLIRAQVAAGLATVLGLAQVAMISKQQFVGSASASPAGLGGTAGDNGGGVQAPDFNIVGQSASNQIAAAVQGQFKQPIKAYVVSKDVSTAQEMDRNIIGSASLG